MFTNTAASAFANSLGSSPLSRIIAHVQVRKFFYKTTCTAGRHALADVSAGEGPITIPYAAIRAIRFTGKDPAAGNSYAAWLDRKAAGKAQGTSAPQR